MRLFAREDFRILSLPTVPQLRIDLSFPSAFSQAEMKFLQTGFPVTSDTEAGISLRQADHCGAFWGDRAHAKETWSQAQLGQERAAPA